MPYVNIKITREGATPTQKASLIQRVTDLLVEVLHKHPASVRRDRRGRDRGLWHRRAPGRGVPAPAAMTWRCIPAPLAFVATGRRTLFATRS
jgi:hypothetical protein